MKINVKEIARTIDKMYAESKSINIDRLSVSRLAVLLSELEKWRTREQKEQRERENAWYANKNRIIVKAKDSDKIKIVLIGRISKNHKAVDEFEKAEERLIKDFSNLRIFNPATYFTCKPYSMTEKEWDAECFNVCIRKISTCDLVVEVNNFDDSQSLALAERLFCIKHNIPIFSITDESQELYDFLSIIKK